jgi:hypothetical protein
MGWLPVPPHRSLLLVDINIRTRPPGVTAPTRQRQRQHQHIHYKPALAAEIAYTTALSGSVDPDSCRGVSWLGTRRGVKW